MRLLIHYAGDVHQPLHATSRIDKNYPKGDFGGNIFPLEEYEGVKELHASWDAVLFEDEGYETLPMDGAKWKHYGHRASKYMTENPIKDEDAKNLSPHVWANDSYQIGKSFVYRGIKENEALPVEYVK